MTREELIDKLDALAKNEGFDYVLEPAVDMLCTDGEEIERLRMQLAACGVIANANTVESAAHCRDMHPDYWCASVADVADTVDREMALRARVAELEAAQRMRPMSEAPERGRFLALVDGDIRIVAYGKTSHVPMYGWCLVDQDPEERDLCEPVGWWPWPSIPEDGQ